MDTDSPAAALANDSGHQSAAYGWARDGTGTLLDADNHADIDNDAADLLVQAAAARERWASCGTRGRGNAPGWGTISRSCISAVRSLLLTVPTVVLVRAAISVFV